MLSVLLVADDDVLGVLATTPDSSSLREELAGGRSPDIVLLDIVEPADAPELTAVLTDALPDAHVLVTGLRPDGDLGLACLRAGAEGVLARDELRDGLYDALHTLGDGRLVLGRAATAAVLDAVRRAPSSRAAVPLTPAQERILDLMTTGATNRAIADRLGLSEKTVKNYATAIYATLGAANRTEAVAMWARLRGSTERVPVDDGTR